MNDDKIPKGMNIIPTQFGDENNISLSDNNYVKMILNKIDEIKDLDIFVLNINVNETKEQTILNLNLKLNKRESGE